MKGVLHARQIGGALLAVFYPNLCQICQTDLYFSERYVCLSCSCDLPYIIQSKYALKRLHQLFQGRTHIRNIHSLLDYQRGNQVQTLLRQLKYNKKRGIGVYFGEILGQAILKSDLPDVIIPVPLHPKKQKKRGFNQSEAIAEGIGKVLNVKIQTNGLKRNKHNASQTAFTKYDRWDNVKSIFSVKKGHGLEGKHVLLVDDVLTTGATIEACVRELLTIDKCSVSIATLAARI